MGNYKLSTTVKDMHNHDLVSVYDEICEYLSLRVLKKHTKSLLKVLEEYAHLIKEEVMISLFDTDTIYNHIKDEWLYNGKAYSGKHPMDLSKDEVVQLYLDYLDGKEVNYRVSDVWFKQKISSLTAASKAEILDALVFGLTFDDARGVIELDNISSRNVPGAGKKPLILSGPQYAKIVEKVRQVYGIERKDGIDLDDFIYEASVRYFAELFGAEYHDQELIDQMAYEAKDVETFKEKIHRVLDVFKIEQNPKTDSKFGKIDEFTAVGRVEFNNPKMIIFSASVFWYLEGLRKPAERFKTVIDVTGDEFWETVWNECGRVHENKLLAKMAEENGAKAPASKLSDKYYMTLGEIQKQLHERYGITLTETAIGAIVKKTLKAAERKMETKGITADMIEDAMMDKGNL